MNGGAYVTPTGDDWKLILPYLQENERLFGIQIERDLLTVDYWQRVQDDLLQGRVPSISVYPDECKLLRQIERLGTYY